MAKTLEDKIAERLNAAGVSGARGKKGEKPEPKPNESSNKKSEKIEQGYVDDKPLNFLKENTLYFF